MAGLSVLEGFAATFHVCWICGTRRGLEIHHIARGVNRKRGRTVRANLFRTCRRCHAAILDAMPTARQLAIKRHNDPAGYNLVAVNRLRSRTDGAITEEEVNRWQ